ncbi:MAG: zinc dependent phospholipase C family protein [Clostridia bacterium]|nr:zinc dependent phospholipase C family protein [Clostridia bacterium]
MPSWVTHLVTANKISEKLDIKDKNSFLFGNIMPDILNNYIVKNTNTHKKYEITHFTDDIVINGIKYAFPNFDKFFEEYKEKKDNPIICGFYVHLITDYFWNMLSYQKHFRNHNGLVEIQFIDGTTEDYEYDPAIKVKQADFRIFTQYLKNNNKIDKIVYTDDLLNLSKEIIEIPLIKEDIEKTLYAVDEYRKNKTDSYKINYRLFTQQILNDYFDESINFIIEKLEEVYK